MINYLYITLSIVFVIDISGFIYSLKLLIFRMLNGKKVKYLPFDLKPIDCSLCMTFWFTLIYGIFYTNFDLILVIFIATVCAYSTRFISDLLKVTYELFNKLLTKIL